MDVLVRPPSGAPPFRISIDQLRHDIDVGRAPKEVWASLDGGVTWLPGHQVTGLSAPGANDEVVKHLIPIGRSGWAIVTGYLSLFTLLVDLALVGLIIAAASAPSGGSKAGAGEVLIIALVCALFGAPAQVATALLARRAMRANPQLLGAGRVMFTWICVGAMAVLMLTLFALVVLR